MAATVEQLIDQAHAAGSSDVHLVCGLPPRYRVDGKLIDMPGHAPLTHDDCEDMARQLVGKNYKSIEDIGELDAATTLAGVRIRINIFRQKGHASMALRLLSDKIPALDTLGLPRAVMNFPRIQRGIVLVTGETGSGKSTTMAALLDSINHTRHEHIITLEDPVEYVYNPDLCTINQREIGTDTESYANGLRAVLREDPDIVLIGEMRDLNTIETALTAAETGHFVLGTLHTNSAAESIDRVVNVFPEGQQQQIRMQLSTTLHAVLSQQLVPKIGGGRALAAELMIVTPAIRNLIREGKTPQIQNALATSAELGSITMDNALLDLYRSNKIDAQVALDASHDEEYVGRIVGNGTLISANAPSAAPASQAAASFGGFGGLGRCVAGTCGFSVFV
ncbi:MAG: PilT/PilU family type 4a pilus ATPase [Coriobacteriia bacterium]|nr:PilT/PilU family type 4a pilus ATPase [Coriobacteriia bacterium]